MLKHQPTPAHLPAVRMDVVEEVGADKLNYKY